MCIVVWYSMVWYGMVWYGMVWYGMVWYDMVCEVELLTGNFSNINELCFVHHVCIYMLFAVVLLNG